VLQEGSLVAIGRSTPARDGGRKTETWTRFPRKRPMTVRLSLFGGESFAAAAADLNDSETEESGTYEDE